MEDIREEKKPAFMTEEVGPAAGGGVMHGEGGSSESPSSKNCIAYIENREAMTAALGKELKMVSQIAIPMMIVSVSQYILRVSPITMVGHLNELALSSTSIATSLCAVTGFSVIFGMASALETLCGQAYGAGQYQRLGSYTYCGIICLLLTCTPISILWIFTDKLLIFIGLDPKISTEARKYSTYLIPSLFPYAILQSLIRYLLAQSLILPMVLSSTITLCIHLPFCWTLIFKSNLGSAGGALSICLSYWLNVIMLLLYVKYSSSCKKTHPLSFSKDIFLTMGKLFKLAIPSSTMICLQWWSYEIIVLMSGRLPNPTVETSVLGICLTVTSVHYLISSSFGVAASTRISNELGAGNPHAARFALFTVLIPAVAEYILASAILFSCRPILGYAFTNEKQVVNYVKQIVPLLCLSVVLDGTQAVLSGVSRGCGLQKLGAYVSLGAYYLAGIPVSVLMGFFWHLRGKGLWSGLLIGAAVQSVLLSLILCFTNWKKQATEARQRIFDEKIPPHNELIE